MILSLVSGNVSLLCIFGRVMSLHCFNHITYTKYVCSYMLSPQKNMIVYYVFNRNFQLNYIHFTLHVYTSLNRYCCFLSLNVILKSNCTHKIGGIYKLVVCKLYLIQIPTTATHTQHHLSKILANENYLLMFSLGNDDGENI